MRKLWMLTIALVLVLGGAACNDAQRDEAGEVADDAGDAAQDVGEDVGDAAKKAADRAEDVVNDRTVNIDNFAFEPAKRTVKVGTEVTWVNQDDTNHTVTEKDKAFESEELAENEEFSHRFTAAGVYNYYCKIHGKDRMSGEITVE